MTRPIEYLGLLAAATVALAAAMVAPASAGDRYGATDSQYESADYGYRASGERSVAEYGDAGDCYRCGPSGFHDDRAWAYEGGGWGFGRASIQRGYVDACAVAHERLGERCPYERRPDLVDDREASESLPEGFFISEGGVGPGIVDFGGGGGGFVFAEGSSNASASASASARAFVSVSVGVRNRGWMRPHYPPRHGGGCGCKR